MKSDPVACPLPRILIVDDDPGTIRLLAQILKDLGKVYFTTQSMEALTLAQSISPDIILLDIEMPGLSGLEVCERIKSDPKFEDVPVLFVTSNVGVDVEARALTGGAIDFIHKPPAAALVKARVRNYLALKQKTDQLKMLSMLDGLTGVSNRRAFDKALAEEWRRAVRMGHSLSLIMLDVDHFKRFNDAYGHQAGDDCLRAVATTIKESVKRPGEMAARYGGEEFAVLLPNCSLDHALALAEIVRSSVEALAIPHGASDACTLVSISCGVAHVCAPIKTNDELPNITLNLRQAALDSTATDLVHEADKALYKAKTNGRNRVETAQLTLRNDVDQQHGG